jgi:CRP/FNR family transcriptional regulator, cyclic AMP receptor protein
MTTLEPILAKHPFFESLDEHYLNIITGCASNVRFKPGDYLFREAEDAHQFFVIREGMVQLEIFMPGRGPIILETIHEGEVLGWSWLFPPYRWHYSGHATTALRAIALDGACLRGKCEADHDLGYELMKRFSHIMVDRLQATRLQLIDLYQVH